LLLALALFATGCGAGGDGADTKPARVYKPNSNQNPDNSAP
jgi:hypothetical protein